MSIKAEKEKAAFLSSAEEMYEELRRWRGANPEASYDEIARRVTPKRRELMGELLGQMAHQHGDGEVLEGVSCEGCGEKMSYKGKSERGIEHLEGESKLTRAYYHCAHCKVGFFPPR